jgi:hypothetical protein
MAENAGKEKGKFAMQAGGSADDCSSSHPATVAGQQSGRRLSAVVDGSEAAQAVYLDGSDGNEIAPREHQIGRAKI